MANQVTIDILADTRGLVNGVNTVNTKLSGLQGSIGKLGTAFGAIGTAFAASGGISWLVDAVKGAVEEEKIFKNLSTLYGKDADKIIKEVNRISSEFYVDDGAIAGYFADLKTSIATRYEKFIPGLVELSILTGGILGKPAEEFVTGWGKALKDGKITIEDLNKLNVDLTQEQANSFNKLKTTSEKLKFILENVVTPELKQKYLESLTPFEKFEYIVGQLKDKVGGLIEKGLKPLADFLIKNVLPVWQKLDPAFKNAIIIFGIAVAVLTPLALGIVGVAIAVTALSTSMLPIIGIAALVVLGIAALAAVVYLVIANWKGISKFFVDTWNNIKKWFSDGVNAVVGFFKELPGKLLGAISGLGTKLYNSGKDIINGLTNGIKAFISNPLKAITDLGNSMIKGFKSLFGIKSPSKIYAGFGKNLMQGLASGITKSAGYVEGAIGGVTGMLDTGFSLTTPTLGFAGNAAGMGGVNITINAGVGTDPYELGRVVKAALVKYEGVNGR